MVNNYEHNIATWNTSVLSSRLNIFRKNWIVSIFLCYSLSYLIEKNTGWLVFHDRHCGFKPLKLNIFVSLRLVELCFVYICWQKEIQYYYLSFNIRKIKSSIFMLYSCKLLKLMVLSIITKYIWVHKLQWCN